jgi:hypothetical protein
MAGVVGLVAVSVSTEDGQTLAIDYTPEATVGDLRGDVTAELGLPASRAKRLALVASNGNVLDSDAASLSSLGAYPRCNRVMALIHAPFSPSPLSSTPPFAASRLGNPLNITARINGTAGPGTPAQTSAASAAPAKKRFPSPAEVAAVNTVCKALVPALEQTVDRIEYATSPITAAERAQLVDKARLERTQTLAGGAVSGTIADEASFDQVCDFVIAAADNVAYAADPGADPKLSGAIFVASTGVRRYRFLSDKLAKLAAGTATAAPAAAAAAPKPAAKSATLASPVAAQAAASASSSSAKVSFPAASTVANVHAACAALNGTLGPLLDRLEIDDGSSIDQRAKQLGVLIAEKSKVLASQSFATNAAFETACAQVIAASDAIASASDPGNDARLAGAIFIAATAVRRLRVLEERWNTLLASLDASIARANSRLVVGEPAPDFDLPSTGPPLLVKTAASASASSAASPRIRLRELRGCTTVIIFLRHFG